MGTISNSLTIQQSTFLSLKVYLTRMVKYFQCGLGKNQIMKFPGRQPSKLFFFSVLGPRLRSVKSFLVFLNILLTFSFAFFD